VEQAIADRLSYHHSDKSFYGYRIALKGPEAKTGVCILNGIPKPQTLWLIRGFSEFDVISTLRNAKAEAFTMPTAFHQSLSGSTVCDTSDSWRVVNSEDDSAATKAMEILDKTCT